MYSIILISVGVIELIFGIVFLYTWYNCAKLNIDEGGIVIIDKKKIIDKKGRIIELKSGYHIEKKTTLKCIYYGFKEALSYIGPINYFLIIIFIVCWIIYNFIKYLVNLFY